MEWWQGVGRRRRSDHDGCCQVVSVAVDDDVKDMGLVIVGLVRGREKNGVRVGERLRENERDRCRLSKNH